MVASMAHIPLCHCVMPPIASEATSSRLGATQIRRDATTRTAQTRQVVGNIRKRYQEAQATYQGWLTGQHRPPCNRRAGSCGFQGDQLVASATHNGRKEQYSRSHS